MRKVPITGFPCGRILVSTGFFLLFREVNMAEQSRNLVFLVVLRHRRNRREQGRD